MIGIMVANGGRVWVGNAADAALAAVSPSRPAGSKRS